MNEVVRPADTTRVSVVIETDSIHPYDDITIADCLDAIRRQTYPRELVEIGAKITRSAMGRGAA